MAAALEGVGEGGVVEDKGRSVAYFTHGEPNGAAFHVDSFFAGYVG